MVPTALDSIGGVLGPGELTDDTGDMQEDVVLGLSTSPPAAPDALPPDNLLLFLPYLLMKSVELRELIMLARSFFSRSVLGSDGVFLMALGLLRALKLGSLGRGLTTGGGS